MSTLVQRLARWLASLCHAAPIQTHPDAMSLHDWADLPVYHPVCA